MSINVLLTSLAILLVTFSTPTLTSPLAAVREQAHESNSLANLRGFMSDLKTKLRGELVIVGICETALHNMLDRVLSGKDTQYF